jgi:hypothetical protein
MNDKPLHIRQAEGLRLFADAIEQNPDLGGHLSFALRSMHDFIVNDDAQPYVELRAFHAAMKAAGADVAVKNGYDKCEVKATFLGAVVVSLSANAAVMAGQQPNPVSYEPLVVED